MSDGKPGNGKARDNFDITVRLVGVNSHDVKLLRATAVNVAPVITEHPAIKKTVVSSDWVMSVTNIKYFDPGILDKFTLSAVWGDGSQTTVKPDLNSNTQPNTARPNELKRTLKPSEQNQEAIYPLTIMVADDDGGTAKYRFERLEVVINSDDDNKNDRPDYRDISPAAHEDDLVMLDLTAILNGHKTDANGTVYLQYRYSDINLPPEQYQPIRLWQNRDKSGQPLNPNSGDGSHYGWVLPGGVTTVWVEGTKIGADHIYVDWVPNRTPSTVDSSAGLKRSLGNVLVSVVLPPLGKLKAEESYWGTPDKWYSTDDDDILWRHNRNQISFHVPEGIDLTKIWSFKLYSISDADISKISFPEVTQISPDTIYATVEEAGARLITHTCHTNKLLINEPGELKLPDGKHNIFGIFEYRSESSTTIRLTNLITKAVIGVEKITWSGVAPSEDPIGDDNFFENAAAQFPEAGLTGSLIFAESNSPTNKPNHGVFAPRTKVEARAVLTIPVPAGMTAKLQARVLDPDHFGTEDFDPNKTNKGNDNVQGRIKVGNIILKLGMTNESFEFLFESEVEEAFKQLEITEPQPGNNWVIGVHDEKIVTDQFYISPSNGVDILRAYRANQLFAIAETNKSKVLTAARTLWVEMDTMGDPPPPRQGQPEIIFNKNPLDISMLTSLLSQALIRVEVLPPILNPRGSVPFVEYFHTQLGPDIADNFRDVKSEQFFWVVHIVDAYGHAVGHDAHDNEWVVGYAHRADEDMANTIYHNVINNVHLSGVKSKTGKDLVPKNTHVKIVVAHEALHRFLGYHTKTDRNGDLHNSYIMSYEVQFDLSLAKLSAKQLRLIQNQIYPM